VPDWKHGANFTGSSLIAVGTMGRNGRASELLAAIRCLRLAAGLPYVVPFFRRDAHVVLASFDRQIEPIAREVLSDERYLKCVLIACRTAAVTTGFAIWSYSRMAGTPFDPYLAALAGSFSRLYDDLLDHGRDSEFGERFTAFLAGERPQAGGETELLVYRYFDAMRQRLSRDPADLVFRAVEEAHRYQCLSRIQRGAGIAPELIDHVISNKGGYGAVAWFGLARRDMLAAEASVVWRIGAVCQLLDDQHDLAADRSSGIRTGATAGRVGPFAVAGEVMRLRRLLVSFYGAGRARRFTGMLCIFTTGMLMRQRRPRLSEPQTLTGPWRILKGPSYTVTPGD
jgi:hypothetical protein